MNRNADSQKIQLLMIEIIHAFEEVNGEVINTPENNRLYEELDWLMAFLQHKIDKSPQYISNYVENDYDNFIKDDIVRMNGTEDIPQHLYNLFIKLQKNRQEMKTRLL